MTRSRATVATVAVTATAAAAAATVAGVVLTGAAAPSLLADPGAVVRWGLPLAGLADDLAAALTVGTLVLAAVALPVGTSRRVHPPAIRLAAIAAVTWTLAALARLILTYADLSGRPPTAPGFGAELVAFARDLDLGRGLAVTVGVAAAVALLAAGARTIATTGGLAVLALIGLVPAALAGHAAAAARHETAVTSLGLHLLGVSVWAGGLAALAIVAPTLGAATSVAAQRFSTMAGAAFVLVAGSGVINAWIRLGGFGGLGTRYGVLVVAKTLAVVVLGAIGYAHRRRTLPRLAAGDRHSFARLVAVELVVMATAIGIAAALARSPTPVPQVAPPQPSLAQELTGYPLPPSPTAARWLTVWQPDLLWVLVCAGLAIGYALGAARLRRRGDSWPVARQIPWTAGVAILAYVTCGAPAAYGRVTFSGHMLSHMALSMLVPALLVLGAPATLALRALAPRRDGSRGAREWLLAVVESRTLAVLGNPIVAGAIFVGSLTGFYYTGAFGLALRTHVGHELMHVHFLLAGYLFASALIGLDPGPRRAPYPLRLMLLLVAMAFHAFFGIALLQGTAVLEPSYFGALGRTWGRDLLADQRLGGGIAWALGELPTLLIAIVLAVQWSQADAREATRRDRAADRDGDAELEAYNAMLASLARRDAVPRDSKGR